MQDTATETEACVSIENRPGNGGELICSHVHGDQNQNKLYNKIGMSLKSSITTFSWKRTKSTV